LTLLTQVIHAVNLNREKWAWEPRSTNYYLEALRRLLGRGFPTVLVVDDFFRQRIIEPSKELGLLESVVLLKYQPAQAVLDLATLYEAARIEDLKCLRASPDLSRPWLQRNHDWSYFELMHSRFAIARQVSKENPFGTRFTAQIDAGFLRATGWPVCAELHPRSSIQMEIPQQQLRIYQVFRMSGQFPAVPNEHERFLGRITPAPIMGGLQIGDSQAWKCFADAYYKSLENWLAAGVPTLDQPMLASLSTHQPSLFSKKNVYGPCRVAYSPYGAAIEDMYRPGWPARSAPFKWYCSSHVLQKRLKELVTGYAAPGVVRDRVGQFIRRNNL